MDCVVKDKEAGQRFFWTTEEGWVACHELPGFVSPKARKENESLVQHPSSHQAWWGTLMLPAFRGRLYKIIAVQCAYQIAVLSTWYVFCVLGWQCEQCACRLLTELSGCRWQLDVDVCISVEFLVRRQQGQSVQFHMGTLELNSLRVQLCKTFFLIFFFWLMKTRFPLSLCDEIPA